MKPAKENTLGDLSKNMGIPASGIGCLSDKLDSLQLSVSACYIIYINLVNDE